MKESILTIVPLHCPQCAFRMSDPPKLRVYPDSVQKGEIHSGKLSCDQCSSEYRIIDGIAVFTTTGSDLKYLEDTDRSVESWICTHFCDVLTMQLPETKLRENDLTGFFAKQKEDRYYADLVDLLLPHLTPDSVFLDMGCAVGRLALELGLKVKCAYGVDPSPSCIRAARDILTSGKLSLSLGDASVPELSSSRSEFLIGDDTSLPFAKGTFDCVCCSSVIDRVPDANVFLTRVDAMVRKGGLLVITDPFDWNPEYSKEEVWLGHGAFGTKNGREEDALAELLQRYGYERIEEKNIPWRTFSHKRNHKVWTVYAGIYRKSSDS